MIRCFILDDEQHAVDTLNKYVRQTPFLELKGSATHSLQAMDFIQQHPVDLLFLDIHMPDISGLELMKILDTRIVLTTAYSEYALEGYEHDVIDYLLKPITYPRFLKAAQKAATLLKINNDNAPKSDRDYFFIKGEHKGRQIKINHADIDYIESAKNYVIFHCGAVKRITIMNLKDVEALLPARLFVRIHNSFIVALFRVVSIESNQVLLKGNSNTMISLAIGTTFKDQFLKRIGS